MRASKVLAVVVVSAFVASMLAGCGGSKVSKDNYDKIKTGMSMADVEGILGKPTEDKGAAGALGDLGGSAKVAVWKDGEKAITVTFLNDKVTTKTQAGL